MAMRRGGATATSTFVESMDFEFMKSPAVMAAGAWLQFPPMHLHCGGPESVLSEVGREGGRGMGG